MYRPNSFGPNPFGPAYGFASGSMNGTAWNDAEQRGLPDNSGSPPFYFRFRPG